MASLKVQILSRKLIKPSCPTPHHLRNLKLSLFDQFAPPAYVSLIIYYMGGGDSANETKNAQRIVQLEKSLADALTCFYPLAGRFVENDVSIDCGDQGVEYFQAQVVNGKLAEFLQDGPRIELLKKFLPWDFPPAHSGTSPLLANQINSFDCGAIAIGLRFSHVIADASTIARFINKWASTSQTGFNQILSLSSSYENFASLFPVRLLLNTPPKPPLPAANNEAKFVTRRFLFDENVITANIKGKAAASMKSKPTRVVVALAVIWKALIGVALAKHGHLRNSVLSLAVDLRGKVGGLQISELRNGNFWMPVAVPFNEANMELHELIILLQGTIRDTKEKLWKANSDGISSMLIDAWRKSELLENGHQTDVYICTSWCRFPLYEADFGWGKPFWVSSAARYFEMISLMDASDGIGVEAWISLKERDMIEFMQEPIISALDSNQ